jgi:hypothetical protein
MMKKRISVKALSMSSLLRGESGKLLWYLVVASIAVAVFLAVFLGLIHVVKGFFLKGS